MRITKSARRHGVSDEAIRHAVTNAIRLIDTDDGVFAIGADAAGRMLELAARSTEDGDLVVFHAMHLRLVNANRYLT
jgi:3-oxoacyl-[acyl-carrier-protein] synthase III